MICCMLFNLDVHKLSEKRFNNMPVSKKWSMTVTTNVQTKTTTIACQPYRLHFYNQKKHCHYLVFCCLLLKWSARKNSRGQTKVCWAHVPAASQLRTPINSILTHKNKHFPLESAQQTGSTENVCGALFAPTRNQCCERKIATTSPIMWFLCSSVRWRLVWAVHRLQWLLVSWAWFHGRKGKLCAHAC